MGLHWAMWRWRAPIISDKILAWRLKSKDFTQLLILSQTICRFAVLESHLTSAMGLFDRRSLLLIGSQRRKACQTITASLEYIKLSGNSLKRGSLLDICSSKFMDESAKSQRSTASLNKRKSPLFFYTLSWRKWNDLVFHCCAPYKC